MASWSEVVARGEDVPPLKLLQPRYSTNISPTGRRTPAVFQLKLRQIGTHHSSFRVYEYGDGNTAPDKNQGKVIMVVGATGSGKTTLINSLINYVFGVEMKDDFRFQLVPDEPSRGQSQSQTECVSSYTLYHQEGSKIPYTLTIIDTPGFGDTGGIAKDEETFRQIHDFFTSKTEIVDHIDGVGFVVKSTECRLGGTDRYIFDSVMSLFGSDIADSMFLMLTFSDCKDAPILHVIKAAQVPIHKSFKFNNSAIFEGITPGVDEEDVRDDEEDVFGKVFWKLGMKSFARFTQELDKMEPKSTSHTKEVLQIRVAIKRYKGSIPHHLEDCVRKQRKLEDCRHIQRQLEHCRNDLNGPQTRVRYFTSSSSVSVEVGENHEEPPVQNQSTWARFQNGVQSLLIRFRTWVQSLFNPQQPNTRSDNYGTTEQHTPTSLVQQPKVIADKGLEQERLEHEQRRLEQERLELEKGIESVRQEIMGLLISIQHNIDKLRIIAMKPDSKSILDYIDLMIMQANDESNPYRQWNIRELQRFRNCSEELMTMGGTNDFEPFTELRKALQAWAYGRGCQPLLNIWVKHMHNN